MSKTAIILGVVLAMGFGVLGVRAQTSEAPGFDFPTIDESPTPTPVDTVSTTLYSTVTPAPESSQSVTDDAETGPEVYILIGLSLLGGLGIFFIKKYFDLKKYEL